MFDGRNTNMKKNHSCGIRGAMVWRQTCVQTAVIIQHCHWFYSSWTCRSLSGPFTITNYWGPQRALVMQATSISIGTDCIRNVNWEMSKMFIYFNITIVDPFLCKHNKHTFNEMSPQTKKKKKTLVRRVALFYIFANFFNVHLNRRKLDSHISDCIQSVAVYCFGGSYLKKIHSYTDKCSWKRGEYFDTPFRQLWIFFHSAPKLNKWPFLQG